MKFFKLLILTLIVSLFSIRSISQNPNKHFDDIFQTYYQVKDTDLVAITLEFVNYPIMPYERMEPMLIGFYGALFSKDSLVKNCFLATIDKFKKPEYKSLFISLFTLNMDSLYKIMQVSPSFNDINWASFFATGDINYLDNIIANIKYGENRVDLNLFLAGESAKWSLCSNAKQDSLVRKYLKSLQGSKETISEILQSDPEKYMQEMNTIMLKQKKNGIWN